MNNNMLKTIEPKSDQLNADDLIGQTKTIKITKVAILAGEQPVALNYEGDNGKPYKPGKSMRRVLVTLWGSDGNNYIGRKMTLYRDDKVMFGGVAVGGIRISHMSDIPEQITMALTASKSNRKPFTVKPLTEADVAQPPKADDRLIAAGKEAAAKGVAIYTAWLAGLSADGKESIKSFHKEWSAEAKKADAAPKAEVTTDPAKIF